ncbi:uncharacterized protein [Bemisia tabaci]|uniref:uncharacterized protein isoform X1 n=2 Tax=Bemisia tabaci TaxID=7038 RepID=UPI003B27EEA6
MHRLQKILMGYWRAIGALETAEAVSKLTPSAPMFQIAVLLSEHIPSSEILNFFGTASTSTSMSSQARPPPPPPNNKEERKEVNVNTPQRQQPVQQQQQYYWYPPYWYPPQYQPPPTNQQYQGAQSQVMRITSDNFSYHSCMCPRSLIYQRSSR